MGQCRRKLNVFAIYYTRIKLGTLLIDWRLMRQPQIHLIQALLGQ